MKNIRKLGENLLLAFSIASSGAGAYFSGKGAIYEFRTENYAVAQRAEDKILAGVSASPQELRALIGVKDNEQTQGVGLAFWFLSALTLPRKNKNYIKPDNPKI